MVARAKAKVKAKEEVKEKEKAARVKRAVHPKRERKASPRQRSNKSKKASNGSLKTLGLLLPMNLEVLLSYNRWPSCKRDKWKIGAICIKIKQ